MSTYQRFFDVIGAAGGLVVFSPVMVAIAAAVWCEDGAPVLFRQERLGRDRRPFTILKFRSMRDGTGVVTSGTAGSRGAGTHP